MNRAYSVVDIKAVDDEQRVIKGIASTPRTDRIGDIVEPMGAIFKTPLPLLLDHVKTDQVGHVVFAKASDDSISFEAQIPKVKEPGLVKDLVDKAWHLAKYNLRQFVSIGFNPLEDGIAMLKSGGVHFKKWEWLELSLVTIPAQPDAVINQLKSLDADLLAEQVTVKPAFERLDVGVTKNSKPGASGKPVVSLRGIGKMSTTSEQITSLEVKRRSLADAMEAIQNKVAAEGRTKDETERQQFDDAGNELEQVNKELEDALRMEKLKAFTAKPVNGASETAATESRGGHIVVRQPQLEPGIRFARVAMAIMAGKGSLSDSLMYAKRWESQTPEVISTIKAVAGNTGDGSGTASSSDDWGAELVYPSVSQEFLNLLMPATVLGRLRGVRDVPFNVRILGQDAGATVNWVGEGQVKPVGELDFSFLQLLYHKIAGIVVISEELVRLSRPNAETLVRDDLVRQIQKFMDEQFLDPNVTATDSRPASITNGVAGTAASGTTADDLYFDLNTALATFDDSAEANDTTITILMRWSTARGISGLRNALGQFEFASLGQAGGTLWGYPVITSKAVPSGNIIIVNGSDIAKADDGRVRLDASNQATIDMNGGSTPTTSLWQRNLLGLRAERFVTWKKLRSTAVARITSAAYAPQPSS